ncbi:hypothetical protein [Mesomycoplasma hyorhinis]|uniref:hypothetical protein n=1 Tax=Mesomycoplasma hyorhinis TaxID=2100 RepID=UPI001C68F3FF|nr:hypothetical protein [Mesomycoplasma hyorhinis]
MGNYIGHACEKSANKIVEDMKKNGYSIQDMKVKRDLKTDKPATRVSVVKSRTR